MGDTWHLDELFVTLQGRRQYLWRAVEEDGDVLDILVQSRPHRRAAVRFFRKLLKRQGCLPRRLITDQPQLPGSASYGDAVRGPLHGSVREQPGGGLTSTDPAARASDAALQVGRPLQRFASVHGVVQNLFRVGRHLLRAVHHRSLRARAFVEWDAVTCAC